MMGGTVAELVALVMSLHILRSLLKPLRRLQPRGSAVEEVEREPAHEPAQLEEKKEPEETKEAW